LDKIFPALQNGSANWVKQYQTLMGRTVAVFTLIPVFNKGFFPDLVCTDGLLLDYLLDLRNPYPPMVMGKKKKSHNKPQNYRLSIGFQK
jgi:hypothetical protein